MGYEIEGAGAVKVGAGAVGDGNGEGEKGGMRVMYLLEGGMVSTGDMVGGQG